MSEPCLKTDSFVDPVKCAAQIIDEYEDFIRCVIRSQNITNTSEDDLLQDFYLEMISRPVPDNIRSIKSYLYRAIINQISDSYRKISMYEKKIEKFRKNFDFKVNKCDLTNALLIKEEMNKMFDFIREISPGQEYMAITLRFRDGYSVEEVANKMGIKHRSVARYISTGLRKIRQCISNS